MPYVERPMALFPNTGDFWVDLVYSNTYTVVGDPYHDDDHIHSYCELYINLRGDVSFSVEDKVYPISHGDIIITKPNEVHRCIYHSDCIHENFCIWINSENYREEMLRPFLDRRSGEGNLISMSKEEKEELITLFTTLQRELDCNEPNARRYAVFFSILDMLSEHRGDTSPATKLPEDLDTILNYINENYKTVCNIDTVCAEFFISPSTLNRRFKTYLHTTPASYIESKRLSNAKKLLERGESVQSACTKSGFSDYSHFIYLFKQKFAITPFKYSKKVLRGEFI